MTELWEWAHLCVDHQHSAEDTPGILVDLSGRCLSASAPVALVLTWMEEQGWRLCMGSLLPELVQFLSLLNAQYVNGRDKR